MLHMLNVACVKYRICQMSQMSIVSFVFQYVKVVYIICRICQIFYQSNVSRMKMWHISFVASDKYGSSVKYLIR